VKSPRESWPRCLGRGSFDSVKIPKYAYGDFVVWITARTLHRRGHHLAKTSASAGVPTMRTSFPSLTFSRCLYRVGPALLSPSCNPPGPALRYRQHVIGSLGILGHSVVPRPTTKSCTKNENSHFDHFAEIFSLFYSSHCLKGGRARFDFSRLALLFCFGGPQVCLNPQPTRRQVNLGSLAATVT